MGDLYWDSNNLNTEQKWSLDTHALIGTMREIGIQESWGIDVNYVIDEWCDKNKKKILDECSNIITLYKSI